MKEKHEDYDKGLQNSYDHWAYLYEHGGSDPFWEDGYNLNLVRNHILYYRGIIEENPTLFGFPDIYYKEIPPEVDNEYMARPDKIRTAARAALERYKADLNYQYLLQHRDGFTPKTRGRLCIDAVIGYATGLEHAINEDKLVDMRRHERCEGYLKSFEDCVRRMQAAPPEAVQNSLFSLSGDLSVDSDEDDFYEDDNDFCDIQTNKKTAKASGLGAEM